MARHPIDGVRKSKPRLPKTTNGKTPKAEISALSKEYLEIRNVGQRAKALRAEMELAERRGELIEKSLVEQQAAYIFVAFRQRILNLGQTWARRFVGLSDVQTAKRLIDEMARSTLAELAQFPERITDPNWLDEVDGNGEEPRPMSPAQAKRAVQAKETANASGRFAVSGPETKRANGFSRFAANRESDRYFRGNRNRYL
jgi:hypothetical protein